MKTQIRPTAIHDDHDNTTSHIRCSYRVEKEHSEPVMLHVGRDGKIWIGYGVEPEGFSFIARVGDRMTNGTSRESICYAANCW